MSVLCSSCGQENGPGAAFCDNCGSGLAAGCPKCGSENRPDAKFCRSCGTALAPAPSAARTETTVAAAPAPSAAAERRHVSVLFADLVAFTTYSEGRDPELVRETLTRYFEATRSVIEAHGGHVEKFIGDAVMAAWGAPRANEDDAERAVRAALEVVDAVRNLDAGLDARVAVLTGQAAVTVGATDQGMVAGDLVNTASRLQGIAEPNTVLVGETTMQAAASAIAFEPAGNQTLKGKGAPVPVWRALRVIGDRGGRSRGEGLDPPFVGRELELRLLKDLLNAIGAEGRPRLVSITGPAGIGKSRLAWEFEKYLDGVVEDIYWHRGRAPSYGEGVTFWALGEMVRKRADLHESDDEATTRQRIHETVAEWIPDEADRALVEPALLTLLGLEPAPAGGRDVLFAAWRIFFERVAARGTTVLLFEDLQWADGGQLDFIDHLMEWARSVPLLVVTLARPELLEQRPGWGTSVRSFNAIGLEPLTDANMRDLLLGLVPEMPPEAVATVGERADGIPLYAVETVRMLVADGRLIANDDGTFRPTGDLGELAVPDTLRALIASRLDALDVSDRELLQDAAVLGKTFGVDALAAISDADPGQLEPRLRPLVKRELLEISVEPGSPERGQYGFVQSVIREVAYDTLSRRDRRARHLAAARYFEGLGDDELAGVLSTHYLAAHRASDEGPEADALQAQARLALRGAADRALSLGSAGQAARFLRQALEITTVAGERGELLERAAFATNIEGSYEVAERLGYEALDAYREAGDRIGIARMSAQMGGILADASKLPQTVEFLTEALASTNEVDVEEYRAHMLARLSRAHMRLSQAVEGIERADQALAIAEPRRLTRIVAEAFINKGWALSLAGRIREPRVLSAAAIELADEVGDMALALRARNNYGQILALDDGDRTMAVSREAYQLATRLGVSQMSQWIIGAIAYGAFDEGLDWDGAIRELEAELEVTRSDSDRARLLSIRQGFMEWRGEDTSELAAEVDRLVRAVSDPDADAWPFYFTGVRALLTGHTDEAITAMRQALTFHSQSTIEYRLGLALSAHLARDLDVAREALDGLQQEPVVGYFVDGLAALASAGVAALEDRRTDAITDFRTAIRAFDRSGNRFDVALTQLDALTLLPGEPAIADWAAEARHRFEVVKAPPLLVLLDQALAVRETAEA